MTYQIDQIQSMISEVDRVLRQTRSRKFWTIFTSHALQRQALERCRNFLVMQQRPTPSASSAQTALQLIPSPKPTSPGMAEANLALELQRLRQEVMHPLRSDVAALGNQRSALQEEIQALMLQKAQLLADCDTVRLNLTQTIPNASQQTAQQTSQQTSQQTVSHAPSLDENELARLQSLHERTNFLLTSMDSSLQIAFGSMQKNVEVYQATLHNGLDRMHHLGYQGEVLFSTLVNRLAQQVGRDMATALPEKPRVSEPRVSEPRVSESRVSEPLGLASDSELSHLVSRIVPPQTASYEAAPQFLEETSAQTATHAWGDRSDPTVNESMNESIDFFFAEFDEPASANSHQTQQSSSLNVRPQQVDAISHPPSLGIVVTDSPPNQPTNNDSLTIEELFMQSEMPSQEIKESEMTLAEMDDLFADVPSL